MPRSHPVCFVGLTQETHNLGSDDTEELSPHEHCDQGLNWMNFLSHAFTRTHMCVHVCACVCVCASMPSLSTSSDPFLFSFNRSDTVCQAHSCVVSHLHCKNGIGTVVSCVHNQVDELMPSIFLLFCLSGITDGCEPPEMHAGN